MGERVSVRARIDVGGVFIVSSSSIAAVVAAAVAATTTTVAVKWALHLLKDEVHQSRFTQLMFLQRQMREKEKRILVVWHHRQPAQYYLPRRQTRRSDE